MITIDVLTKKGSLIKLDPAEAEEVYQALKALFDKTPITYPSYPMWPYYYPNWPYYTSGNAT